MIAGPANPRTRDNRPEVGADVLEGDLRYPSETGGWRLGDLDLSEYLDRYCHCDTGTRGRLSAEAGPDGCCHGAVRGALVGRVSLKGRPGTEEEKHHVDRECRGRQQRVTQCAGRCSSTWMACLYLMKLRRPELTSLPCCISAVRPSQPSRNCTPR